MPTNSTAFNSNLVNSCQSSHLGPCLFRRIINLTAIYVGILISHAHKWIEHGHSYFNRTTTDLFDNEYVSFNKPFLFTTCDISSCTNHANSTHTKINRNRLKINIKCFWFQG
eukprot:NODE_1069_length_2345_cov_0.491541.p4 type:complete len:112 gc:universal NODE_1069_length_2345_cov_0.491541:278-613(+)